MTQNPYKSPLAETCQAKSTSAQAKPARRRRGRIIMAVVALGIIAWDVSLFAVNESAVGLFLVDACAAHFMWTGSRVARWLCGLRCLVPCIIALPVALLMLNGFFVVSTILGIAAGICIVASPSVRAFSEFQRSRKSDVCFTE